MYLYGMWSVQVAVVEKRQEKIEVEKLMSCVKLVCFLPGNIKYICLFTIAISCTIRSGDITGVQLV